VIVWLNEKGISVEFRRADLGRLCHDLTTGLLGATEEVRMRLSRFLKKNTSYLYRQTTKALVKTSNVAQPFGK
jgi:hypothetical protein